MCQLCTNVEYLIDQTTIMRSVVENQAQNLDKVEDISSVHRSSIKLILGAIGDLTDRMVRVETLLSVVQHNAGLGVQHDTRIAGLD